MEVILLKNLRALGDKHDVVSVKNGYGRNYLIPKGLAVLANKPNMAKLDELISREQAEEDKRVEEYKEILSSLADKTLKIGVKSGTSGKIFGSITNIQIANALRDQFKIDIPRKKIAIDEEIKVIGTYSAALKLHEQVTGSIEFDLIKE